MSKALIIIGFVGLFSGCEELEKTKEIPECIEDKINKILEGAVWNPPAKIYRYQYNGHFVYYFPARCCDIPSILYNENCNVICSPDGGISGKGDGKCLDFFSLRTDEKLLWEDTREYTTK